MNPIVLALVTLMGFIAQYLDVSIGLGYGTFTSPLLLLLGVPPTYAVPAILFTKTILGVFSGGVHVVAGNIQRKIVLTLIVMGSIGTVLGVFITVLLGVREVSAIIGVIFMVTGFLSLLNTARGVKMGEYSQNKIRITGFFAGIVNAVSGGGYGAISTTGLISGGVDAPIAVGSTVLSEAAVALSGVLLYSYILKEINWELTLALLIGGIISTPIGALATKRTPSKRLGAFIGVIVIALGASSAYVQSETFVLGVVLIALILIIYHFKMIGYIRLRFALGGINLGIGAFLISLIYLNQIGSIPLNVPLSLSSLFFYGIISISAIFIIAGILSLSVERRIDL